MNKKIAQELQRDLDERRTRRVFAEGRGPNSVSEAYALQRALRRVREARGEQVVGFKIGYTSPTVRNNNMHIMGLSESVHGYLWDTEAHPDGSIVDHRRLGIEGELGIKLLDTQSEQVAQWQVAYGPIIELHAMGMDGPDLDNQGRRGLELIGTNCIHAGVVHAPNTKVSSLGEVPLDQPMTVSIGAEQIERVTLTELEVDGVFGPVGTVAWLVRTLKAEARGDDALLKEGAILICSTPGGLHPVPVNAEVEVAFDGLKTTCVSSS